MIIEASQINSNGGIVLLELLLRHLSCCNTKVLVYIAYEAVYERLKKYQSDSIILQRTSPWATFFRYMRKRDKVLYFCNLPPFVRNRDSVFYIHNLFFVNKPRWTKDDSTLSLNLRKFVYYLWIKLFINKVTVTGCQTVEMQRLLNENFGKPALLLPFYEEVKVVENTREKEFDFFYPGSSDNHKYNVRLLDAVAKALEQVKFRIALTLDDRNPKLLEMITRINSLYDFHPVVNLGKISHDEVFEIYGRSKALLFPSLKESLGLPLIEANQLGLKVLVSNLPFANDILVNPITFDPKSSDSIATVIMNFLQGTYDEVVQSLKLSNKIKELLDFLR